MYIYFASINRIRCEGVHNVQGLLICFSVSVYFTVNTRTRSLISMPTRCTDFKSLEALVSNTYIYIFYSFIFLSKQLRHYVVRF